MIKYKGTMAFGSVDLATLDLNCAVVRAKHELSGSFALCYLTIGRPFTGAWIETCPVISR